MTDVTLRVREDGADDERIEQLTTFLRSELQEFAAVSGVPGEAPAGAKAIDLNELGTLLTTVSQSTVLAALINAVSSWLGQRRERSVTVEADGDTLELTGAPSKAELAQRSAWLGRHLHRYALIIASYEFADPGLASLRAPAHDAARLGEVLADPRIGAFDVQTLINTSAAEVNEAVEDFFADRDPDDLLVLHFSGHGVKDEAGELHFATSGTKLNRLAGTAVSADFVARRMNRSRSRRIVLLLDCCYSGAFGRGMVARAGGSVGIEEQFGGSGRAVITASSAMEYAFEGASVADTSESEPSVFTSALVEGLESGDADRDQDGHVGLDELYEYVYDRVRRVTPHQTPGKWMLDVRGDLRIARRARPVSVPAPLPAELQDAIDHSLPGVRAGAVPELRRMLTVAHEGRALAARMALRRLVDDDSRMVAMAARKALGEPGETGEPPKSGSSTTTAAASGKASSSKASTRAAPSGSAAPASVAASSTASASAAPASAAPASTAPASTESRSATSATAESRPPTSASTKPEQDRSRIVRTASGAASATSAAIPRRTPTTPTAPTTPDHPEPPHVASPEAVKAAIPRVAAGLALTFLTIGLVSVPGGILGHMSDASPSTWLFGSLWPWALVAAMFAVTCRDHPWAAGAALGFLAGMTGLLAGTGDTYLWFLLGIAATALAIACRTSPWWMAAAGGVLGAAGVFVVGSSTGDLDTIEGADLAFIAAAAGLIGLAGYRIWRERAWVGAIAPVLLLLDAALNLTGVPSYVAHASLAGLIVVPLIAALTSGIARFAGYLAVAAGLLVRANEYVSAGEPSFTTIAHVTLPLAAAVVAYFSRSR
ncbi:caspase family protein [Lentzea sp. BCCO 10_0856]|uniref:Caspase family protein n=1 Tax=Lentzea miocenica TaxID=3095431 RepID=A0ABU4SXJ5_9PSEU|nr:caspase family protein [Lentzea sp. BCCO 10_0856]MDX8030626.1 caspase family protein [Lentzea sp. BCCO 10_0856]